MQLPVPLCPSHSNYFRNCNTSYKQQWSSCTNHTSQPRRHPTSSYLYLIIVPPTNSRFRQISCEWVTSWGYSWSTGGGDGDGGGSHSSGTAGCTGAEEETEEMPSWTRHSGENSGESHLCRLCFTCTWGVHGYCTWALNIVEWSRQHTGTVWWYSTPT